MHTHTHTQPAQLLASHGSLVKTLFSLFSPTKLRVAARTANAIVDARVRFLRRLQADLRIYGSEVMLQDVLTAHWASANAMAAAAAVLGQRARTLQLVFDEMEDTVPMEIRTDLATIVLSVFDLYCSVVRARQHLVQVLAEPGLPVGGITTLVYGVSAHVYTWEPHTLVYTQQLHTPSQSLTRTILCLGVCVQGRCSSRCRTHSLESWLLPAVCVGLRRCYRERAAPP